MTHNGKYLGKEGIRSAILPSQKMKTTKFFVAGRKRRRTDKIRQSRRDKKVSKSQRQAMIKNLVNFKDERAFCDYKIIVPGQPVRISY